MVPGMFKWGGDLSDIAYRWEKGQDAIRQRKKAADDAFDKYLKDQSKVSGEGIRTQDREAFQGIYDDLVKYGIENKKLINSNPSAKMEFENRWKSLSRFAEDSKAKEKKKEPLNSTLLDPNKRDQIVYDDVIDAIDKHDQPLLIKDKTGAWVKNPNQVDIDYTKDYFQPKPIDVPGLMQKWAYGKKPSETKGMPLKNDPNTPEGRNRMAREVVVQPITIGYSDKSIKEIGQVAEQSILLDASLNTRFKRELQNLGKPENAKRYKELSAVLDSKFPGETIDSPAKVAKAIALEAAINAGEVKEEEIEDKEARLVRQKREKSQAQARADQRAKMRASVGELTNPFDRINATFTGGSVKNGVVTDASGKPFTGEIELKENQIPPYLRVGLAGLSLKAGAKNKFTVKDGVIQDMTPGRSMTNMFATPPKITRDDINAGIELKLPSAKRGVFGGGGEGDNPLELEF
jgi:hypothetical protein